MQLLSRSRSEELAEQLSCEGTAEVQVVLETAMQEVGYDAFHTSFEQLEDAGVGYQMPIRIINVAYEGH
jgi:hypothetical protein